MKKIFENHKILILSICIITYLLITFYAGEFFEQNAKVISCSIIAIITVITIVLSAKDKGKNKVDRIIFFVIAVGVIIRAMYIGYTPITERQHDVYSINDQGHLGYIYTIYETRQITRN